MDRATVLPDVDPIVPLVFREATYFDSDLYLGSWHSAPVADGSTDELCLEVYVADGAAEPRDCWSLALFAAGRLAMAGLQPAGCCFVCFIGAWIDARLET